jgi:hypothetical protein
MENEFNFYNWGYGMCVAINDGLDNAIPSANYFNYMLSQRASGTFGAMSDYAEITNLFDDNATFEKVLLGFIDLAIKAKAGDIVTVYFALHGSSSQTSNSSRRSNKLSLKNTYLTEEELYLLLKLFRPDVRVVLVMDICQSGSWIDTPNLESCKEYEAYQSLKKKVDRFCSKATYQTILNLYTAFLQTKLDATITVIGAINDRLGVNDDICFATFLRAVSSKRGNLNLNMDNLIKELRRRAVLIIQNIDGDYCYRVTDDINLWKAYYASYSEIILNCPMEFKDSPSFHSQNQHHQEAMLHFLPTVNFIGPNHEKYFDKNAFCVN